VTPTILVDDHLLLRVLLGAEPPEYGRESGTIATTGLWYHRLCRALADRTVVGTMSRSLGAVGEPMSSAAIGAIVRLPESIQLVSLRSLAWPMAKLLDSGSRLNLLSLEALAAAQHLGAGIYLADIDDNPPLRAAAGRVGVDVHLVSV
jgi:hypothetical protein